MYRLFLTYRGKRTLAVAADVVHLNAPEAQYLHMIIGTGCNDYMLKDEVCQERQQPEA